MTEKSKQMEQTGAETPKQGEATESMPATSGKRLTLKNIFLGDFLINDFLRRQAKLLLLITIYTVIYISNRYSVQQEMIEIDRLRKELMDIKYDALTRSSELMELSRQSRIEEYIMTRDSKLQTATNPQKRQGLIQRNR